MTFACEASRYCLSKYLLRPTPRPGIYPQPYLRYSSTNRLNRAPQHPHQHGGKPKWSQFKGKTRKTIILFSSIAFALSTYTLWQEYKSKPFDPPRFTPFTIIDREEVSPTSIILTLKPDAQRMSPFRKYQDPYKEAWEKGTWSVEIKQPQLQIARAYTPLPPREGDPDENLRFLIRKEYNGEVSRYIHDLPVGRIVELRGPNTEFALPSEVTDVVFLAGGTGIAPGLQIAHTLLERRKNQPPPKIHIVWANRRREDCKGGYNSSQVYMGPGGNHALQDYQMELMLLEQQNKKRVMMARQESASSMDAQTGYIVRELQHLQNRFPGNLQVDYLVDDEGTFLDQNKLAPLVKTHSEVKFGPVHTRIDSKLLFVSGPEGFVNYLAGPKQWVGGKEGQGDLGGLLRRMEIRDWKIWKL